MFRFLRELKCFLSARAWPGRIEWNQEDQKTLELFLLSANGRKAMDMLALESFEQDRHATVRSGDPRFNNGVAVGFRIAIATLQAFAQSGAEPDINAQPSHGEDGLRERIAP